MPYTYKKEGSKYVVYKKDTGKRVGSTKGDKESLRKYLAALHLNAEGIINEAEVLYSPETVIKGDALSRNVWVGQKQLDPQVSLNLRNHSPDGFNWGYAGSGPSQLALAILYELTDDKDFALKNYQQFKFDVISKLKGGEDFTLPVSDVITWIKNREIKPEYLKLLERTDIAKKEEYFDDFSETGSQSDCELYIHFADGWSFSINFNIDYSVIQVDKETRETPAVYDTILDDISINEITITNNKTNEYEVDKVPLDNEVTDKSIKYLKDYLSQHFDNV